MAAYAALLSLSHTVEGLLNHPRPPISLGVSLIESLAENISFFLEFLEGCSHGIDAEEWRDLEIRIADAALGAEDVIESHIVDQIFEETSSSRTAFLGGNFYENRREQICAIDLHYCLHEMDFIKKQVIVIKEKAASIQHHLQRNPIPEDSQTSSFTTQSIVVGFDDEVIEIMDKLTGSQSSRQIIPIVGMGGIGKTTLAKSVYSDSLIQQHFDICAWITISQEYNEQELLKALLSQLKIGGNGDSSELGVTLHKHLTGRRYLVVMDDMWGIEAWEVIQFYFPDNDNGSRIIVTTRQSNLASQLIDSYCLSMKFLDVDKSWNLFCKVVFGDKGCPFELEEIGKKIAKGCRGLPLSISVIGGLLAKSKCEREYWDYIADNLNSVVNLEDNERCLKVLHMSYDQLPVHLKPCFLYVGVFPEDHKIRVSMLIELWVAEGFLKPISGKSLEEVAQKYFNDLVDRNLVLVDEVGSTGNIKYCNIHDLLRDLCLRQAQKERFYNVMKQHSSDAPQDKSTHLHIVFPLWKPSPENVYHFNVPSVRFTRSLFYCSWRSPSLQNFRLLRIIRRFNFGAFFKYRNTLEDIFHLVNLRYFAVTAQGISSSFPSIYRLWNLHTINVEHLGIMTAPSEIWKMPQLRCIKFKMVNLPDPEYMDGNDTVL